MNILLDTHVLLWWLDDNPVLSDKARMPISDGSNLIFVSAAAIWEIRIKQNLGKLDIPPNFRQILEQQPFEFLAITIDHCRDRGRNRVDASQLAEALEPAADGRRV